MNRRDFLIGTAAAAAVASTRTVWGQSAPGPKGAKQSTLDRISIMTLNFQRILKVPDVQESPDRPVFRGNGSDDYLCVQCGNVLAVSMDPDYMDFKVRVRCAKCGCGCSEMTD